MTTPKQTISLRPATSEDLPFLDELRHTTLSPIVTNHHAWDDAKQQARVRAHFESAKIITFNGEAIGLWKVYRDGDNLHLGQIQVLPEHQGRGIGAHLISDLKQEARQLGMPITLRVYRSNPAARLYQRLGFHIAAEAADMFAMAWNAETKQDGFPSSQTMIHPKKLKAGDTVALLSPSSPQTKANALLIPKAIALLESWGLKVRNLSSVDASHPYLAGTDQHRARMVHEAYTDPEIKALLFTRGGYGSARLLKHFDLGKLQPHQKIVAGYSDVTSLLLLFQKLCGMVVYHGPNLAAPRLHEGPGAQISRESLKSALFGVNQDACHKVIPLNSGSVTAEMIGGNLTLLACSIGTVCEPDTTDKILFIEDVSEAPYQVDRLLTHLRNAGKLDQAKGVVFSDMAGCLNDRGLLWDMMRNEFAGAPYPVVYGLASGHGETCVTLPLGARAHLDATNGTLNLLV